MVVTYLYRVSFVSVTKRNVYQLVSRDEIMYRSCFFVTKQ